MQPEHKISSVGADAGSGDKGGNGGNSKAKVVTDRYYKRSEYNKLTNEQEEALRQLCLKFETER